MLTMVLNNYFIYYHSCLFLCVLLNKSILDFNKYDNLKVAGFFRTQPPRLVLMSLNYQVEEHGEKR